MPDVEASVLLALRDGEWGKYDGKYTDELAESLAARFQQPWVTLCSSGTIGIELALRGLGVEAGQEVILGGYDFPGNFRAIELVGATPVLVDLPAHQFALSLQSIESGVSSKTTAVIVSHLHGSLAPMQEIMAWSKQRGISIVEDACQCPGATFEALPAGSFGDASVLSFGGSKLLSAGRGGAVLTRDERVHQRIRIIQDRGNWAFPLSQLQAAAILPQLEKLDDLSQRRASAAKLLRDGLASHSEISIPVPGEHSSPAFYKLPMTLATQSRDAFCDAAQRLKIPLFPGFRGFAARSSRRCRIASELDNSKRYATQTALLHHAALLIDEREILRMATVLGSIIESILDADTGNQ